MSATTLEPGWRWLRPVSAIVGRGDPAEIRRLGAWLLLWVILANVGFALLWIIGSPPRHLTIVIVGAVGVVIRTAPATVKRTAFAAVMAYSVLVFVCRLFNVAPLQMLASINALPEMRLAASPDYLVAGTGLVVLMVAGMIVAGRDMAFESRRSLLTAIVAILAWAAVDLAATGRDDARYHRTAPPGAAFESAVHASGLLRGAADRRHLMLIDVEAMGLPRDRAALMRILAPLHTPRMQARFATRQGTTIFYGATVNSEIRELCGRWGDAASLLDTPDPGCLPAMLARRGYATTAIHGFTPEIYGRDLWYPNAGFAHMMFRPELMATGVGACPGVFPGACDRDVPAVVARMVTHARVPQFIHWVTLNSHFPVPSLADLHTADCATFDRELARSGPMACRMMMLWRETFASLAAQIGADGFPPIDILIVGDHRPPFLDRRQRAMFDDDRVPWLLLRSRQTRITCGAAGPCSW